MLLLPPSPKFQAQALGGPLELSIKLPGWPWQVFAVVNAATGNGLITIVSMAVLEHPPSETTTCVMIYVPGALYACVVLSVFASGEPSPKSHVSERIKPVVTVELSFMFTNWFTQALLIALISAATSLRTITTWNSISVQPAAPLETVSEVM